MASRILLKLIDEAILPAVLVIATKVISLAVLVYILDLPVSLQLTLPFPQLNFINQMQLALLNSWSNLAVLIMLTLGLLFILLRAWFLHDTHISPMMTLRLFAWDLQGLIAGSFEVYHQAVVWLSYLWLTLLVIFAHTLIGLNHTWVTLLAFFLTILMTAFFIWDVEREVAI